MTVFEIDPKTHSRLHTTGNTTTPADLISTLTNSAPDDYSGQVLTIHIPSTALPEQGPNLHDGIVTMDDATYTTTLCLHSGPSATSRLKAPGSC